MKNKNIIIFGPQGSGKGTQADILSAKFNIPHISTGDIFRKNTKEQTDLGKKITAFLAEGKLVSDKITNEVVKKRLEQPDCQNGFILDGFPRNLNQAEFLNKFKKIWLALEIWISDQETLRRISGRYSCPKCGAIYHTEFKPPKKRGICDKCGTKLIIRNDEEAIAKRLKIYHEQTMPLIAYYKKQEIYKKIDGTPPIPEVTEKIMKIFK